MVPPDDLTVLLGELERGDPAARERLWPLVYEELHAIAARAMRKERPDHTLQTTALVHEAWLRLVDQTQVGRNGRAHFLATAAGVIRHILVDHARARGADKRGGERHRLSLTVAEGVPAGGGRGGAAGGAVAGWAGAPAASGQPGQQVLDILALDEALKELAALSERQAKVVELRFFAGLDVDETAAALGVSPRTIKGDWRVARAWLADRLGGGGARSGH